MATAFGDSALLALVGAAVGVALSSALIVLTQLAALRFAMTRR